jgi:hypothetical protein
MRARAASGGHRYSRWDVVGVLCVLAFALSLTVLLTQRNAPTHSAVAQGPSEVQLGVEWMGLRMGQRRVGLMRLEKTTRAGGYRFALQTRLRFVALEQEQQINMQVDADLDAALTLQAFSFEVEAGPARFRGQGTVVAGPAIEMRITTGGETSTRRVPLGAAPVMRANLGPLLSQQALEPGATFRLHTFDPLTQSDQAIDIEVVGREPMVVMGETVQAIHLEQRVNGLVLHGWINARGEMLRQELGMGLVAVRETEAEAQWGLTEVRAGRAAPDLMRASMIQVPGLPATLERQPQLTLYAHGYDLSRFNFTGGRQRLVGEQLTVTREPIGAGLPLPVQQAPEGTLAADALIQADHPKIRQAAQAAIGDARDTVQATRRLLRWMHAELEQQLVPGVPSALETLQAKVGDCNEHSTLFAAMARSVGVPTRIAVGLVYQEGAFGYHAWNEILTADGWLTVDATWQQLPADVGHLRLVYGGLAKQVALLPVFGQLELSLRPKSQE